MRKGILKLLIISLCISAFIGITIILTGKFGELEAKILGTTSTVFAFSIAGLCCSTIYNNEKYKLFSLFGIIASLLGSLWLILMIWEFFDFFLISRNFSIWRTLFTFILLSYSSAHISLILLIKNQNTIVTTIRKLTVAFSLILDIMLLTIIWDMFTEFDFYGRLIWVFAILITLGTIILPILNKMYKSPKHIVEPESNDN